jgi:hypothetical protein
MGGVWIVDHLYKYLGGDAGRDERSVDFLCVVVITAFDLD